MPTRIRTWFRLAGTVALETEDLSGMWHAVDGSLCREVPSFSGENNRYAARVDSFLFRSQTRSLLSGVSMSQTCLEGRGCKSEQLRPLDPSATAKPWRTRRIFEPLPDHCAHPQAHPHTQHQTTLTPPALASYQNTSLPQRPHPVKPATH